ncbi:MAG: hypothetical protein V1750_09540 [Acidobacteriota bacterium]
MMAAEGPFVAALMARLAEPKFNLAAFGVAFALAMFIEAPIIMIMSAATALVRDRASFLALRRFLYTANALITGLMGVLLVPGVFDLLTMRLIGLPENVAHLAHVATAIFLPWPAAIGYRRFYQGVMIRHGLTRRVAYGTIVRLSSMAVVGSMLFAFSSLPGVYVGAAALATGVVLEAIASRLMAAGVVRRLLRGDVAATSFSAPLTASRIASFYFPLALTSLLSIGVYPLVTFFVGRSRFALESLAVLPVVSSLVFVFRASGLACQEVNIALLGDRAEQVRPLARFAAGVAAATAGALALLAFTPFARIWLQGVAGLSDELASFALAPIRVLCVMPALEVLLSLQRAQLVHARRTALITWGTAIEVTGIVVVLAVGIGALDLVGAVAAAAGMLVGRLGANAFLLRPSVRAVR